MNIAANFDDARLPAFRDHFFKQADEKREHGMTFVRYLLDANASVEIPAIPSPRHKFASG